MYFVFTVKQHELPVGGTVAKCCKVRIVSFSETCFPTSPFLRCKFVLIYVFREEGIVCIVIYRQLTLQKASNAGTRLVSSQLCIVFLHDICVCIIFNFILFMIIVNT